MTEAQMTASEWETVVRTVLPVEDVEATLPLYLVDWSATRLSDEVMDARVDMGAVDFSNLNRSEFKRLVHESLQGMGAGSGSVAADIASRYALRVHPGARVSTCTYFNAFPASYWRRWTQVRRVRLALAAEGTGQVIVMRSTGRGLLFEVGRIPVEGETDVALEVALDGFMDGGFLWFDVEAAPGESVDVHDAAWQVEAAHRRTADATTLSVAITTFNRPRYCARQLAALRDNAPLRDRLDTIYVVDQGNQRVADEPDFAGLAADLGPQLTYLTQRNLGGSGGFSRGMLETVRAAKSSYVLLLDDDAISEPESIVRAVQFADYATRPTIVGGAMLHLDNRTVLYAQGEHFDLDNTKMSAAGGRDYNHDFAVEPLASSSDLHQRLDTDYNGWWTCLIPTEVVRKVGLSMPVFIKFDDIEYALRAREAGYPTVSLPGCAVWHQAWHDKNPERTWEDYFINRNRWITALLHTDHLPRRFMYEAVGGDATRGVRLLYSSLRLRHMALEDLLRGPDYIVKSLPDKLAEVRRARAEFPDAQAKDSYDAFPVPRGEFVPGKLGLLSDADNQKAEFKEVARCLASGVDATADDRPDIAIPAKDFEWTAFVGVRSALVSSSDGNSVSWFKRNDPHFRREFFEGVRLAREVARRWDELSRSYQAYGFASIATWERILAPELEGEKS